MPIGPAANLSEDVGGSNFTFKDTWTQRVRDELGNIRAVRDIATVQQVAAKADQSALSSLTTTVGTKAAKSDLDALGITIAGKANAADLNAIFPSGGRTYYISGDGDDTPGTPGTVDKPYATWMGFVNAMSQSKILTNFPVNVSIGSGNYSETIFMAGPLLSSNAINIRATNPSAPPRFRCPDGFGIAGNTNITIANVNFDISGSGVVVSRGATVSFTNCSLSIGSVVSLTAQNFAALSLNNTTLNLVRNNMDAVFYSYGNSIIEIQPNSNVHIKLDATSSYLNVSNACIVDNYGLFRSAGGTLSSEGDIRGSRYGAYGCSLINLNGAGPYFFPGTTDGTVTAGSYYQ